MIGAHCLILTEDVFHYWDGEELRRLNIWVQLGRHLTKEEAAKEALALRISQKFALLEEVRPVLETMAYHDKYKKVLDEIWKKSGIRWNDYERRGRSNKKVNENALADTGSDINTMP
ncbi:hypothetical protein Tco_0065084 [Tanacetum coccineum]